MKNKVPHNIRNVYKAVLKMGYGIEIVKRDEDPFYTHSHNPIPENAVILTPNTMWGGGEK